MMTIHRTTHILVVDDNEGDIRLFREALYDIERVELHAAMNLVQARDFLAHRPPFSDAPIPDLIFLDLRLPIFPGYDLLPTIRTDPILSHIKVVVFTSSNHATDRRRCFELGADDYVVKPRGWPEWRAEVMSAIARHTPRADDGSTWKLTLS